MTTQSIHPSPSHSPLSRPSDAFWQRVRPFVLFGVALLLFLLIGYWGGTVKVDALFLTGLGVLASVMFFFGALTWWLYLSPVGQGRLDTSDKSDRSDKSDARSSLMRQLVSTLVVISSFLLAVGAFWDEVWHRKYGIGGVLNDFLWPPHMMMYGSIGLCALFALGGLIFALRQQGDLRQRFRAEPLIGLLALMSSFQIASIPSDLLWHQIYGLDISAWSLPHLFLMLGVSAVTLSAVAIHLSFIGMQPWKAWRGLALSEFFALLLLALALLFTVQFATTEWDGLKGPLVLHGSASNRPEWLYPVVLIALVLFYGRCAHYTLRRAGSATLVVVVALLVRLLLINALDGWQLGIGINGSLLLLPAAIALDVWLAWQQPKLSQEGETGRTLLMGNLFAGLIHLLCVLPFIAQYMVYPRINAQTLPPMIFFTLLMGAWFGWVGARLGGWLRTLDAATEPAVQTTPRLLWAGVALFLLALGSSAYIIFTTPPPVG